MKKKQNDIPKRIFYYWYSRAPDWLLGKHEEWTARFRCWFGNSFFPGLEEERIQRERKKLFASYLTVSAVCLTLCLAALTADPAEPFYGTIDRPSPGEKAYTLPLKAELRWSGKIFTEKTAVRVAAREPDAEEKERALAELEDRLPHMIRRENESLDYVNSSLDLIRRDPDTGAALRWFSADPKRVDSDGSVDPIGLKGPENVALKAELQLGEARRQVCLNVRLQPPAEEASCRESLIHRMDQALTLAAGQRNEESLKLPSSLGDGATVRWMPEKKNRNTGAVPVLGIAACLILYRRRYAALEKESRGRRETMRREFPDLVDQMVLLLNAGMVVSAALAEAAESAGDGSSGEDSPLFSELSRIADRVRRTNASFTGELMIFAQGTGIRELIRFASIVADNVDKGSSLAEKLEREACLLRSGQRKRAEELGRLADTKLSFPLMILLLILILIAVAPVMFEV